MSYFIETFMRSINKKLDNSFDKILNERWIINKINLIAIQLPLKLIVK